VDITSEEDVRLALQFARDNHLQITSAGQQHSMGGQSFVQNGLVLNMKPFHKMWLDKERKILRVQSGATWAEVQKTLDAEGLAVRVMQSINIFTVGGTLSVNAHGLDPNPGPIAPTVRSLRIMLSNGDIQTVSRTQNPELFSHVLGGYGLFAVILDAELDVMENEQYLRSSTYMGYDEFPEHYLRSLKNNPELGLMYARLSISPTSYLKEIAVHAYQRIVTSELPEPLEFPGDPWLYRFVINFSKTGRLGRWVRWTLEKYAEPQLHLCSRNEAFSRREVCVVSRNQETSNNMAFLRNRLRDTDILQEYFVPPEHMEAFVDGLRDIVTANGANLLNVTLRPVKQDPITAMPYAKRDMFGFVLYFNQKFTEKDSRILQKTTQDLTDLVLGLDGTFYLPYRLYYSKDQLRRAYPGADAFFATKKKYDPLALFSNTFYETYGK
jgi:FAD/FMN-containing dehydrogenase